eukprot:NODE_245_length_11874_cov_0.539546.p4 type:complete len:283 gc:universal NODE_245_length_11874_cov_0.539546:3569-2721(-)
MLDKLDEFILEKIFSFLDRNDLLSLMTLNSRIFESSERILYRNTVLTKRRDYEILRENLDRVSRYIKRLYIPTGTRFQNIEFLLKLSRQLRVLSELDLRDMHLPRNYFHIITKRCPTLKVINLSRTDVSDTCLYLISQNCKSLQKIELFECNFISDYGVRQFEDTGVLHLNISSQKATACILQHLPKHLITFHSERLGKIRPSFLKNLPSTLKSIKITGSSICNAGIWNIFHSCPVLERLTIIRGLQWHPFPTGYCRQKSLSKEEIEQYLNKFPSLQCIHQE